MFIVLLGWVNVIANILIFYIVGYFYTDCNIRWVLALFYKMFNMDSVMIDYD